MSKQRKGQWLANEVKKIHGNHANLTTLFYMSDEEFNTIMNRQEDEDP